MRPHDLLADVTTTLRRWRRAPAGPAIAGATLVLGLAALTAIFTHIRSFSRPFPGVRAQRLMVVNQATKASPWGTLAYADVLDYAAADYGAIEGFAWEGGGYAASVRHEAFTEVIFGEAVSGNYFSLMGIRMAAGRGLRPDDDQAGAPPVVVLSYRYWRSRFGGDPSVIGDPILLNNNPYTIAGVAGEDFVGSRAGFRPDVWMPLEQYALVYWARSDARTNRNRPGVQLYVRLRRGASVDGARSELQAVATGLNEEVPLEQGIRTLALRPATWIDPTQAAAEAPVNRAMLLAALALLVLVCANVANVLLSMVVGRGRELAIRAAVGASRATLGRQLVVENTMLALGAGMVAVLLADPVASRIGWYFARPSIWGATVPQEVSLDAGVVLFAVGIAVLVGIGTALVPAVRGTGLYPLRALRGDTFGPQGPNRSVRPAGLPDLRHVLVAGQLALAVGLTVLSALVLETLQSARRIDPGFDTDRLMGSYMSTSSSGVPVDERVRFYRDLAHHFEAEPWVRKATVAAAAPLSPHPRGDFRVDGQAEAARLLFAQVVPGFFETIGVEAVAGRLFVEGDTAGNPDVAIVNRTLANRYFPGEQAVGRSIWRTGADPDQDRRFEIVGVVRDAKVEDLFAGPEPVVYLSYPQHYYTPGNAVILSTTIDPAEAVPLFEAELRRVDPTLALVNAVPYADVLEGFRFTQRRSAEIFSVVALLALALAAAGLYGVLALAVGERRREVGIRMALGAGPVAIVRAMLKRPAAAVVVGGAVGLALSLAASPLIRGVLYGVAPGNPRALLGAVGVLLGVAIVAALLPLVRALRLDPVVSLREG